VESLVWASAASALSDQLSLLPNPLVYFGITHAMKINEAHDGVPRSFCELDLIKHLFHSSFYWNLLAKADPQSFSSLVNHPSMAKIQEDMPDLVVGVDFGMTYTGTPLPEIDSS
jgi:hypothetical protein